MGAIRQITIVAIACAGLGAGAARSADDTVSPQAASGSPQAEEHPKKPSDAVPASLPVPPSLTVIEALEAHGILGRDVRGPGDENMGRIADVIVDRGGQTRAAVIDFGGFLGVGSRRIVVDWNALRFAQVAQKSEKISLALTRDQVRAAPEYKEDQPIVVLGESGSLEPLRFRPRDIREK